MKWSKVLIVISTIFASFLLLFLTNLLINTRSTTKSSDLISFNVAFTNDDNSKDYESDNQDASEDITEPEQEPDTGTETIPDTGSGNGTNSETEGDSNNQDSENDTSPEPEPPAKVILCLGDSVTNGYPYASTGQTYPAQLQSILNTTYGSGKVTVINRGVNGYRADQVLASVSSWLVQDNPDIVLLMIGGNDLKEATIETIFEIINQTVYEVQQTVNITKSHTNVNGTHPKIIVSAFIPNQLEGFLGSTAIALYNNKLASDLSGEDKWFTDNWVDLYDTVTGQAKSTLMADTTHPNSTGYSIIANNWFQQVTSYVTQ